MATEQQAGLASTHRYKLKPPTFNGDYAQYEEWKYKFLAYMGLQRTDHTRLMTDSEQATTKITDQGLEGAATTQEEATTWKQLSQEMKYILTRPLGNGWTHVELLPTAMDGLTTALFLQSQDY